MVPQRTLQREVSSRWRWDPERLRRVRPAGPDDRATYRPCGTWTSRSRASGTAPTRATRPDNISAPPRGVRATRSSVAGSRPREARRTTRPPGAPPAPAHTRENAEARLSWTPKLLWERITTRASTYAVRKVPTYRPVPDAPAHSGNLAVCRLPARVADTKCTICAQPRPRVVF